MKLYLRKDIEGMEFFLQFDISFFSVLMLVVFFITIKARKESKGTSINLFFRLLWVTVYLLLLEVLSWAFDRVEGYYYLNYFFNMMFAWSTSLITCIWASYIDYQIFGSYERLKRRWLYAHTFIITGALLLINIFKPFIFTVSPVNVYSREAGMIVLPILNILVFVYIAYIAFKKRRSIQKEVVLVILMYIIIPAIAAFLQVLLFGVFILWPTMAVTVVLTYIFLETVSTSKDYLTGLLSRHRFDSYLEYMLTHNKEFILLMLDLNDFKKINDTYGHLSGDLALKVFSETLTKKFSESRIICRYAGDEFMIILDKYNEEEMIIELENITNSMKAIYDNNELPYMVTYSYGYQVVTKDDRYIYNTLVHEVDEKMYIHKSMK